MQLLLLLLLENCKGAPDRYSGISSACLNKPESSLSYLDGCTVVDLLEVGIHGLVWVLIDVATRNGSDKAVVQQQTNKRHWSERLFKQETIKHSSISWNWELFTRSMTCSLQE